LLLIVDLAGKVLEGRRKPFSELELHLQAYRARQKSSACSTPTRRTPPRSG